jgi:hypothetical protein
VSDTYFAAPELRTIDGTDTEWFTPNDLARGPWDPEACHGGPPTALLVRAMERAVPAMRLVRVTVDLAKPVPMAGFSIHATVTRSGRSVAATAVTLRDVDEVVRATAIGLHIATLDTPMFDGPLDNAGVEWPRFADAVPGTFPIRKIRHGLLGFRDSVEMRYPQGTVAGDIGSSTVWMRTIGIVAGEEPTPFQRICPLADCGNAFSRHAEAETVSFLNPDLAIALHRSPVGEWLGMQSVSQWQPDGIGLVASTLFDDSGPVGTATQTMLLRPA